MIGRNRKMTNKNNANSNDLKRQCGLMIGNSHIVKDISHKIHIERDIFLITCQQERGGGANRKGVSVVLQLKITTTTTNS